MRDWSIHPACKAMDAGDFAAVRTFCMEMFDHELSDHDAKVICTRWAGRTRKELHWDTACGPAIWIKNRLLELHALDAPHNPPTDFDDLATAVLHTFFLSLEETAEMMAILHNEDVMTADDRKKPARSKMFNTPLEVQPIDSTAATVTNSRPKKK